MKSSFWRALRPRSLAWSPKASKGTRTALRVSHELQHSRGEWEIENWGSVVICWKWCATLNPNPLAALAFNANCCWPNLWFWIFKSPYLPRFCHSSLLNHRLFMIRSPFFMEKSHFCITTVHHFTHTKPIKWLWYQTKLGNPHSLG